MDNPFSSTDAWSLFASAFLSSTILPGSSELVLAYLVSESRLQPAYLLIIATLGNTLGAMTTWMLGLLASLGYAVSRSGGRYNDKALSLVRRWGPIALLFSWMPLIGDALCLAGGWLRLPLPLSMLAITVGKAARYAVIVMALS